MNEKERLLSHKETAKILGLASQTLYGMRGQRRGPDYVKIGRKPMYEMSSIRRYIESNRVKLSA